MESIGFLAGWVAGWAAGWVAGWPSSDPQCPRERASHELRVRVRIRGRRPGAIRRCIRNRWDPMETYPKQYVKGCFQAGRPAGWLAAEKLENLVRQSCF